MQAPEHTLSETSVCCAHAALEKSDMELDSMHKNDGL